MKLAFDLVIATPLRHAKWDRPTLLLDHSEVLQVFVRVEKELPGVKLYEDAGHRPQVTLLIPGLVLEDDLGSAVLSSVDDQCVPLVRIGGASEVNYLDLARGWLVVLAAANLLTLP